MFLKTTILTVALISYVNSQDTGIAEKFAQDEIVPDLIPTGPTSELCVQYPTFNVTPGKILTYAEAKEKPAFVKWDGDLQKNYTLIMLDPDVPSRTDHSFRSYPHWLVVNIPGSDVSKGEEAWVYAKPSPPSNVGLHRYVFLVWEQTVCIIPTAVEPRAYSMTDMVAEYKLVEVPVAGNYFQFESKS